jgi:alpha-mannosidase
MGDDLEPIVMFDAAKPGGKVLVAVKLTRSTEPKHFEGADLRIVRNSGQPNSETLWQEIFSAAEFAPALGPDLANATRRIEAASAAVDFDALQRGDQQSFDRSITKAHGSLQQLSEPVKKLSVQLTGNSHIDAAWLWPWTETVDVVRRTFGTALLLMDEYPQLHYAQSAAQYSEWMEQKYPPLFQRTVDRAKENRWELVGGMWVEPDLNMPDGESLVRQLLIGEALFSTKVRRRRPHRLESRFVWVQLATSANLQKVRNRLFRNPENELERDQPTSLDPVLVAISRWQPRLDLLPTGLRRVH